MANDTWFCLNCNSVVELDLHGRCSVCSSDAVDIAVRPFKVSVPSVEELEKLYAEDE